MKKTMILGAAALAATMAMGVESSTVGYNKLSLAVKAKQLAGVPFQNTTGAAIDIQQIIPLEKGEAIGEGEAKIWWWDTDQNKYVYAYWTEDLYEDDGSDEGVALNKAGWCNNLEDLFIVNQSFAAGQGFWIQPAGSHTAPTVQIAGKVVAADTDRVGIDMVAKAKQLMACPFPVDTDLQDVIPLNGENEIGEGEGKIWWWDTATGAYTYAYWTEDLYEDDGSDEGVALNKAGWCNNLEDLFIVNHTFKAGEGFWIQPAGSHTKPNVTFDNPLK